jgi:hypothetical protein
LEESALADQGETEDARLHEGDYKCPAERGPPAV